MTDDPSAPHPDIARTLELAAPVAARRRIGRWVAAAAALAAAAVAVALLLPNHSGEPRYQTAKVARGDLTVIVTATGTLQPTNEVDVGSELSGIVKTVEADYNDRSRSARCWRGSTPPGSRRRSCSRRRPSGQREARVRAGRGDRKRDAAQARAREGALGPEVRVRGGARHRPGGRRSRRGHAPERAQPWLRPGPTLKVDRTNLAKAVDPLADQRHRADAEGRARPDRGRHVPGAGAVHAGRGPDADGAARRRGRGRRRPGEGRAGGNVHRGRLSGPHVPRADHRRCATARQDRERRRHLQDGARGRTTPSCCCGRA